MPKKPTLNNPMMMRPIVNTCCLDRVTLFLPFQLKISDRNRIAFLYTRLAQSLIHAKRFHDLLESAHGTIMLPIRHRSSAFNGRAGDAPFIGSLARDNKVTRVLFRFVDW